MNDINNGDPFASDTAAAAPPAATHPQLTNRPAPSLEERVGSFFAPDGGGWTYRAATDADTADVFFVHSRERDVCYIVHVASNPAEGLCTCQGFAHEKTCLHLLAMQDELAFLAWIDEQERLYDPEGAEHPVYGCDPDMHYDRAGNADAC